MQLLPLSLAFLALLWPTAARAGFPGERFAESPVVGAGVAVARGEGEGARLGWGLDVGYQLQWYTQRARWIGEEYWVWAEEHPAPGYGPMARLWRLDGAWQVSVGVRGAVTWPLRVGLMDGWWPGPGLGVEAGYLISTAGFHGFDLQGLLELPWVQLRYGQAWTGRGWQAQRLHAGVFTPTLQPHLWPETDTVAWRDPE